MIDLTADHLLRLRGLVSRRDQTASVTALPGGVVTRPRGRGLETAELRAFEPGDDPRHLDRNATARTGLPQVRLFHAERDRTTILIADFRSSMLWGTRRTLRSIAAAEALVIRGWDAVRLGGRVGLIVVTSEDVELLSPRARDRAMVRVIGGMVHAHQIAMRNPAADEPALTDTLALAHRIAPRGSDVILASALDHPGSGFNDRILALKNRTRLHILRIADAFETETPTGSYRFATAFQPEGRIGQPAAVMSADTLSESLRVPVTLYPAAQNPEATLHG